MVDTFSCIMHPLGCIIHLTLLFYSVLCPTILLVRARVRDAGTGGGGQEGQLSLLPFARRGKGGRSVIHSGAKKKAQKNPNHPDWQSNKRF